MKEDASASGMDSNQYHNNEHTVNNNINADKPNSGGDYPANMYQHEKQGTLYLDIFVLRCGQ